VFSFSRADITTDLRSGPTITRSIASSQSFISMIDLLRRAAKQGGLVEQILEVGARETRRAPGQRLE